MVGEHREDAGRLEQAAEDYERQVNAAVASDQNFAEAHANRGDILQDLTDSTYGPASASLTQGVRWPFTGFFSPVVHAAQPESG